MPNAFRSFLLPTLFRITLAFGSSCLCPNPGDAATAAEQATEVRLAKARKSPLELYQFLYSMPKGGDLHNHLSGAVYAESYLKQAAADSFCIDTSTWAFVAPKSGGCRAGQKDATLAETDPKIASEMIDSLSMRDFVPGEGAGEASGHDHFFAAFDKFAPVSHNHEGEAVAEVAARAAEQNESYVELMALTGSAAIPLGAKVGMTSDLEATRQNLMAAGLLNIVTMLRARVDELDGERVKFLGCSDHPDAKACALTVRYVFQVLRNMPKEKVFAQMLAGFLLAEQDPRIVGINFVQPEDYFFSMEDYHLHMQMVAFARRTFPAVHVSLHAGELAPGLVPPSGLRFHIREAVEIARAERIGHGVDIGYEDDQAGILAMMKARRVDVEINLTSNAGILGISGPNHPFPLYRRAGVPVTLSTDDEGVSRTHLTEEYRRAVETYGLHYVELKELVRNSLEYSFLEGKSLWSDWTYRSRTPPCAAGMGTIQCKTFLAENPKARIQADLERRFLTFETAH